ncbi:hypothetical protein V500_10146, partial [Pseudogymnoascus sp. VKM F-4518 (FW-2643)]
QDAQELANETDAVAVDAEQVREIPQQGPGVEDLVDHVGDVGVRVGRERGPD